MGDLDIIRLEEASYPRVWSNKWKIIEVDDIGGRLNVMWLTPGGKGISSRDLSHMTILNKILDNYTKPDEEQFWDIIEVSKHNVNDPVILTKRQDYEPNNNEHLAGLMSRFMKHSGFSRVSGPYREQTFGGSSDGYGHASRVLALATEKPDFNVETFTLFTEPQVKFLKKIINLYNIGRDEINLQDYSSGFDKEDEKYSEKAREQLYG